MSDYGLRAGDKVQSPFNGLVYDVLEVEGRFALIKGVHSGDAFPLVCDDQVWCSRIGGMPWTVNKPRWRAEVQESTHVIYDSGRDGSDYAVALWPDDSNLTYADVSEVADAILDLLNERFPA